MLSSSSYFLDNWTTVPLPQSNLTTRKLVAALTLPNIPISREFSVETTVREFDLDFVKGLVYEYLDYRNETKGFWIKQQSCGEVKVHWIGKWWVPVWSYFQLRFGMQNNRIIASHTILDEPSSFAPEVISKKIIYNPMDPKTLIEFNATVSLPLSPLILQVPDKFWIRLFCSFEGVGIVRLDVINFRMVDGNVYLDLEGKTLVFLTYFSFLKSYFVLGYDLHNEICFYDR